jgi:hypothetical protein
MQKSLERSLMTLLFSSLVLVSWTESSDATDPKKSPQPKQKIILVQALFDHPEIYNDKKVVVTGVASIEFENTAIRSPGFKATGKDLAVWLELPKLKSEYKNFDRETIQVLGVFHAGKQGHFGMFDGSITDITEIKIQEK